MGFLSMLLSQVSAMLAGAGERLFSKTLRRFLTKHKGRQVRVLLVNGHESSGHIGSVGFDYVVVHTSSGDEAVPTSHIAAILVENP